LIIFTKKTYNQQLILGNSMADDSMVKEEF
jgi:hypothetical protein